MIWIIALGVIGGVLIVLLLMMPNENKLAVSRLRPQQAEEKTSVLTAAASATTGALQKAMTGRETKFAETLALASLKLKPAEFMLWTIVTAVVAAAAGWLLGGLPLTLLMALAGVGAMFGWLRFRAGGRRKKFSKQMTETLQTLAGALRAGQSLPAAIQMVAEDSDSPTKEEFARVVNEVRIGASMHEALLGVAARTRNEDMMWVVRAIGISNDVGGSLSDVMDGVVQTIQARTELRATVKTMSSEGKMSALTLGALPFVVAAAVSILSPGYLTPLFTDWIGWAVLASSAVQFGLAALWMKSIINLKY